MTFLMMTIKSWDRGDDTATPTVEDVSREFNLAAGEIDAGFGVIPLAPKEHAVMVTPDAAKKMYAAHIDNSVKGKGPFVTGPWSNSQLSLYKP